MLLDGYVYTLHCENADKTRWRCTYCNKKCSAILYTSGEVVRARHPHNHDAPQRNPIDNWIPRKAFIIRESSKKTHINSATHDYGLGVTFFNKLISIDKISSNWILLKKNIFLQGDSSKYNSYYSYMDIKETIWGWIEAYII